MLHDDLINDWHVVGSHSVVKLQKRSCDLFWKHCGSLHVKTPFGKSAHIAMIVLHVAINTELYPPVTSLLAIVFVHSSSNRRDWKWVRSSVDVVHNVTLHFFPLPMAFCLVSIKKNHANYATSLTANDLINSCDLLSLHAYESRVLEWLSSMPRRANGFSLFCFYTVSVLIDFDLRWWSFEPKLL